MDVWLVVWDLGYEGRSTESVWSSEAAAEAEASRLAAVRRSLPGQHYAQKVLIDTIDGAHEA